MLQVTSLLLHGSELRHGDKTGGHPLPADQQPMKFLLSFQVGRAAATIFSLGLSFFSAFLVVQPRPRRVGGSEC